MKPSDITDKLTSSLDAAYSEEMNLTSPSASGTFMELKRTGKLGETQLLCGEAQTLVRQLQQIEKKLQDCNQPTALFNLFETWERNKKDPVIELPALTTKLETRKHEIKRRLLSMKILLNKEAPILARFTENIEPPVSFPIRPGGRTPSLSVRFRNDIIRKWAHLSTEEICKKLDLEFLSRGGASELPVTWVEKYGVQSFWGAYKHPRCMALVRTMISKQLNRTLKENISAR